MADPSRNHGLVARGAPVKPPLFKMPQKMVISESDKAYGGGVTVAGRTQMDSHGSYYQPKQKVEKFDSGLDEMTQYRLVMDVPVTPISCTEDERGPLTEYVYRPKAKTFEAPATMRTTVTKPKVESHLDISSDSAIELSTSSIGSKKIKPEVNEIGKIDSTVLRTVHQLFVEDEDGER